MRHGLSFSSMTAAALLSLACSSAAPQRKTGASPPPASGNAPETLALIESSKELPPPTMTPDAVRQALWDIGARQRRGEASAVLGDYHDRAQQTPTLEARFLAAAAIPDEESAWRGFKSIAVDQPRFYWAHLGMAAIYARWKIRDQGEKELDLALKLRPDISYTYTVRGDLYRRIGEHRLAVRDYEKALESDPKDSDARVGLALSRRALGESEGYEAQLQRALADRPTQYEGAEALALWYDEQNQVAEARKAWERLEKLAPKNRGAKLALARLRGDADPNGAILAYEAAAKLQPLSVGELEALSRLYRTQRRSADEIETLQLLTRLDPGKLDHWRRLAELHTAAGDLDAREASYKSILAIDSKDVGALMGLGQVAERRAQIREAIDFFEQAKSFGSVAAGVELDRLFDTCLMPRSPISGNSLNVYYRRMSESLESLYTKRLEEAPALAGQLKVRIVTDGAGKALEVEILENGLSDPWLEAHLYYAVLGSKLPPFAADKRRFALTFDLPAQKD